jgi:chromosome segregation ATPase
MKQKLEMDNRPDGGDVHELLERRATVQGWLARLGEQTGKVSDRVFDRVRADYERRLQDTLQALASHRDGVRDELDRTTTRFIAAEEAHLRAEEELEEARLRYVIGEIEEGRWSQVEPDLAAAVTAAAEDVVQIRGEADRLRDLLEQLEERTPTPTPVFAIEIALQEEEIVEVTSRPPSASAPLDFDEIRSFEELDGDLPEIDGLADLEPDDAFLDRIDRALASPEVESDILSEDTAPKPGIKCAECGYTNDLSAWFCGVCGADIG